MKYILIFFLCFNFYCIAFFENDKAAALYKNGDFQDAKEIYENMVIQNPDNIHALFNLAKVFYKLKDFDNARKSFDQVAKSTHLLPMEKEQAYFQLGDSLAQLNKYEEAIQAYKNVLKINPENKYAASRIKLMEELLKKQKQQEEQQKNDQENQEEESSKDEQSKNNSSDKENKKDQKDSKSTQKQENSENNRDGGGNSKQSPKDAKKQNKEQQKGEQDKSKRGDNGAKNHKETQSDDLKDAQKNHDNKTQQDNAKTDQHKNDSDKKSDKTINNNKIDPKQVQEGIKSEEPKKMGASKKDEISGVGEDNNQKQQLLKENLQRKLSSQEIQLLDYIEKQDAQAYKDLVKAQLNNGTQSEQHVYKNW